MRVERSGLEIMEWPKEEFQDAESSTLDSSEPLLTLFFPIFE